MEATQAILCKNSDAFFGLREPIADGQHVGVRLWVWHLALQQIHHGLDAGANFGGSRVEVATGRLEAASAISRESPCSGLPITVD